MKILVFSDSHGNTSNMEAAIREQQRTDLLLFLGDGLRDAEAVFARHPEIPHAEVPGNCDFFAGAQSCEITIETEDGLRIFLCHGHTAGVKFGLGTAVLKAQQAGASLLLFGHTHEPEIRYFPAGADGSQPVSAMNPGSIRSGSYGLIQTVRGQPLCSLATVGHHFD